MMINPKNTDILYIETEDWLGVLQSTDGGKSWHKLDIDLPNTPVYLLAIDPSNPNILYLATHGRGLFSLTIKR